MKIDPHAPLAAWLIAGVFVLAIALIEDESGATRQASVAETIPSLIDPARPRIKPFDAPARLSETP